jgi:import receptor subunit TOM20
VKKNGELPTGLEEKEAYFMEQVAKGESLCASEGAENEAAISFWKALKVYPQPQVISPTPSIISNFLTISSYRT